MKFCETNPSGILYGMLSSRNIEGNSGLSYLKLRDFTYVENPSEADVFVSINGKCSPNFVLSKTILMITEPRSRDPYRGMYTKNFRNIFGGFMGINKEVDIAQDEFYFVPQSYGGILDIKEEPENFMAMIHQRYKKEYRDLPGDREREKAVKFFDQTLGYDFHTYGRVWHKTLPWENVGWKGTLPGSIMGNEKISTLRNYKFVLCFENSRENGYISEKIFSSLFSGSIPIYFGAPDISDCIPKDCYIEFDGQDYDALYKEIQSIDSQKCQEMRTCARQFLASSECEQFTSIGLAKRLEKNFIKLQNNSNNLYSLDNLSRRAKLNFFKIKRRISDYSSKV
ncbi:MAG: glycosyltransferase family 10 [Crocosphaera sp.]|nr:glycosyltransferase family 10 [Crocosphaera sp.]